MTRSPDPTPQDSPRPSQTMMVALRAVRRHSLPLIQHYSTGGYAIIRLVPRQRLAWFPKWVGDRLKLDGYIDSTGQLTPLGVEVLKEKTE